MNWVKDLLAKYTNADGVIDADGFNTAFATEFPKNAVPKNEFNAKNEALKSATADLEKLQKSTGDIEALRQQIKDAQDKATAAEADYQKLVKDTAISKALADAGGKDVDYLAYKLGDVKVEDLENSIKDLRAKLPDYFPAPEKNENEPKPGDGNGEGSGNLGGGYRVLDNGLKGGGSNSEMDNLEAQLREAMGVPAPTT